MSQTPNDQTAAAAETGYDAAFTPAAEAETTAAPESAPVVDEAPAPVDDAAPADGDQPEGDAPPAEPVAPAPYEGLIAPEGTILDPATMELATPLMREFGVPDDKAQAFLNGAAPILAKVGEAAIAGFTQQLADNRATMTAEWAGQLRTDPEIGGAAYDQNMTIAAKGRDMLFGAAGKALLEETGFGNNPEVVRACLRAGRELSDDMIHRTDPSQQTRPGDGLYDPAFSPKV